MNDEEFIRGMQSNLELYILARAECEEGSDLAFAMDKVIDTTQSMLHYISHLWGIIGELAEQCRGATNETL